MSCCIFTDEEITEYNLDIPSDFEVTQLVKNFMGHNKTMNGISSGGPKGSIHQGTHQPPPNIPGCCCDVCTYVMTPSDPNGDLTTPCSDTPGCYKRAIANAR